MPVTIHCIKRTDNMSSLSPNEDGRRRSPRKSASQMPHYLAREYNEHKEGKGGKKWGGGVKKWAKESEALSDDDSNTSIKPTKKSRGLQVVKKVGGQVNRSIEGVKRGESDEAKNGDKGEDGIGL